MKPVTNALFVALLLSVFVATAGAQAKNDPKPVVTTQPPAIETVELSDLLAAVRKNSKKMFLINRHVQPVVVIGQANVRDTDYAMLLQILRNNDLATFTVDGVVNVVPLNIIRQYALPMIPEDDSMHDEEWVTGVLRLENAPAASMVPIMRPMMPQAGHVAADPISNSVIIVDRLGNAKLIFSLIRQLDQDSPGQDE